MATRPVLDPSVTKEVLLEGIEVLLTRIDDKNASIDSLQARLNARDRELIAVRQLARSRFEAWGGRLGIPGHASIVGCTVRDVDGNRIEVSL